MRCHSKTQLKKMPLKTKVKKDGMKNHSEKKMRLKTTVKKNATQNHSEKKCHPKPQ